MAMVCSKKDDDVNNSNSRRSSRGRPQTVDISTVEKLYESGMTDGEIAEIMGVDRSTIAKIRKKIGLPATRPVGKNLRAGTGQRKKVDAEEEAALRAWMRRAQAVNAAEMSRKMKITAEKMISWGRSAYTWRKPAYVCTDDGRARQMPACWKPPGW